MTILIRKVRTEQGIGLRELSRKTGISYQHLSKLENEKVDIKLSTLCTLAKALNVDPCMLFSCEG